VFDVASIESPFAEEDEFQEFVEDGLDLREFRRRRGTTGDADGN